MIEGVPTGAAAVGAIMAAAFGAITLLAKFKGWLDFGRDEGKFRADLMAQVRAEREQSEKDARTLDAMRADLTWMAGEVMRLQVWLDAIRAQNRQMIEMLGRIAAGTMAPQAIVVPEPIQVPGPAPRPGAPG